MSSQNHFATAFKNNCMSRPRHPETNLPLTTEEALNGGNTSVNESSLEMQKRLTYERQLDEELERSRADFNTGEDEEEHEKTESGKYHSKIIDNDLTNLLQDDTKFYKHLQALRLENKKTLKMLERFYHSKPRSKEPSKPPRDFISKMKHEVDAEKEDILANKIYDSIASSNAEESEENYNESKNDDYRYLGFDKRSVDLSSSESEEDPRKDWPRIHSQNILPDDKEEDFRGREFSYQVIDNMWDNFSVDSYAPVEKGSKEEPPQQKEWKPSITIPQPFNMTVREAAKAKVKSKRKEKLEKELLEKKMAEEAELNKKFRARPLPASTFMKLYKEQQAEEEQKREYRKSLNKAILEATQQPFGFMKREEDKIELRRSQSIERLDRTMSRTPGFKATPFPEKLFNLSLEDKIAEQNEYRKIKIKMRSEEMLAGSSLPPNMQARGERYAINKRYGKKYEKSSKQKAKNISFKPNINHDIPDYEELHRKFEIDLIRRRREKSPTICEPFNLHTAKVPTRRSHAMASWSPDGPERTMMRSLERSKESSVRRSNSSLRNGSLSDEAPPFGMTETARMRHSLKQDTLAKETKAEEEEHKKAERRRRREEKLRQQVTRKSIGNDMKRVLEKENKEKLKRFRESEMARKQAYKEYLKEIKTRVDQRPLLFEQESQTNAKRAAQRKYKQILKEAGVDDNILDSLVTDDGKIVDAESDDDTDDLLLGADEADQLGFSSYEQKAHDTIVLDDTEGGESEPEEIIDDAE